MKELELFRENFEFKIKNQKRPFLVAPLGSQPKILVVYPPADRHLSASHTHTPEFRSVVGRCHTESMPKVVVFRSSRMVGSCQSVVQ